MKIIAVCGFGIGSSALLKIKIEEALSRMGISAEVEVSDITTASGKKADVYITSPTFASQLDASSLLVIQNFMNANEIQEKLSGFLSKEKPCL